MSTSHFRAERQGREVNRPLGRLWPSDYDGDDDDDDVWDCEGD